MVMVNHNGPRQWPNLLAETIEGESFSLSAEICSDDQRSKPGVVILWSIFSHFLERILIYLNP